MYRQNTVALFACFIIDCTIFFISPSDQNIKNYTKRIWLQSFFFLLFNFPIIHYFFFTVCVFYLMQHLKIHRTNACQLKYQMYIKKKKMSFVFTKGQSILHEWKQCCDFTQNAPSPLMLPTLPPNIGLFPHHMETHTFFLKHFSNHFFCKIKNKQMHIPWKMNVSVFYVSTAHIHYLHRASEVL